MAAILAKEGHYLATMEAFLSSLEAAEKRFDFVEEMVLRGTLGAFSTVTRKLNTISRRSYTYLLLPAALFYSPPSVLQFSVLSLFQFIESPLTLVP